MNECLIFYFHHVLMTDFNYIVDRFDDCQILRYQVPGFETLPVDQKLYIYYLNQAALAGRDILWDQHYKHNLTIRKLCEAIYTNYTDDKQKADFVFFVEYLKKIWMWNGIHHHYSMDKFIPKFSETFLAEQISKLSLDQIPLQAGQSVETFIASISPIIFDPNKDAKKVSLDSSSDVILASANNFYDGVSQQEVEYFYKQMKVEWDDSHPSWGLNSQLVKENWVILEKVWKSDAMYGHTIQEITKYLRLAMDYANDNQKLIITLLIEFYQTWDLHIFDDYSIAWLQDVDSHVDFINGFIEVYGDPLGLKGSWEALVNFKDIEASKRTTIISDNAQWFQDHSPVDPRFKKEVVKWVSAKVITAAILGWDCYPATPIGINLPNAEWIRAQYGSKSVTIENITKAYDEASKWSGSLDEFMASPEHVAFEKKYGYQTSNLHTDLHECLGHGSGKVLPWISKDALKEYGSTIEEGRADLFALWYMADPKLLELWLLSDAEAYKAEYYSYMLGWAITQIVRIQFGKDIEESHMRNRSFIAKWVIERADASVLEIKNVEGKTKLYVYDYEKLRTLFGELLAEVQRIKSEWDFDAAKKLVETYGIKIDPVLHEEILARYATLNLAPYKWFVNPKYELILDENKKPIDVSIDYSEWYADQMLRYSREYSGS